MTSVTGFQTFPGGYRRRRPRFVSDWQQQSVSPSDEWTLVPVSNAALKDPRFRQWLKLAEVEATRGLMDVPSTSQLPPILLLLSNDAPIEELRDLLACSPTAIDFLLGPEPAWSNESAALAELARQGFVVQSVGEGSASAYADDDDGSAVARAANLEPYIHPHYRLSDDSYSRWFERLRQDPKKRGD